MLRIHLAKNVRRMPCAFAMFSYVECIANAFSDAQLKDLRRINCLSDGEDVLTLFDAEAPLLAAPNALSKRVRSARLDS